MASIQERIERVIAEVVRPLVEADGGSVVLVGVDPDGTVRVRLGRACMGCPGVGLTASMVIEAVLKKAVPEIARVVAEATAA